MKKKIKPKYENLTELNGEPLGSGGIRVPDFLPSADEIAKELAIEKVNIGLSKDSLDFIRVEAKRVHCSYQKIIRRLIDDAVNQWRRAYSS